MPPSIYTVTLLLGIVCAVLWTQPAILSKQRIFVDDSNVITDSACKVISSVISSEASVHYPGSPEYRTDIHHWSGSAIEESRCSIQPADANDLGRILQILGWTRTPFAITGGGHSLNPGFSSTTGIHIAMSQFNKLQHNEEEGTIDIGAGLRWDDVYGLLNPKGYTVVGGRVNGVGVAGFILGGGLSWITNERGLTIDTLVSCEVVLPNGTVVNASADVNPDLFFGLKGGFNNFGIVTRFTLQVFPQSDIWGGAVIVPESRIEQANQAIVNFVDTVRDPKATMNIIFEYAEGSMNAIVIVFYNAPEPPAGMFDEVLHLEGGVVQVSSMPFLSLLAAGQPRNTPRRIQDVAPVQSYSVSLLNKVANETKYWGSYLEKHHSGHFFDYVVEVFLPDYFNHGSSSSSAWPADRGTVHFPINIAFAWHDQAHDKAIYDALAQTVNKLKTDAEEEGQEVENASLYPNIVVAGKPLEKLYGSKLQRLREIRDVYDPTRVMDMAGGWHF
ncbi:FAD-binding domain-containing protein [Dendrothele bispora CBS 962.96]|uniref:FAD-binding domain-containing protein n=1 Tax=Dendrothele bispora (strain CBS 962.96) TaxID=1314807 RepID=A0A4S8L7J8_DENBC|nr:FAD-binding domain-containing protein [Dendrothele bispora CBS 962.96]